MAHVRMLNRGDGDDLGVLGRVLGHEEECFPSIVVEMRETGALHMRPCPAFDQDSQARRPSAPTSLPVCDCPGGRGSPPCQAERQRDDPQDGSRSIERSQGGRIRCGCEGLPSRIGAEDCDVESVIWCDVPVPSGQIDVEERFARARGGCFADEDLGSQTFREVVMDVGRHAVADELGCRLFEILGVESAGCCALVVGSPWRWGQPLGWGKRSKTNQGCASRDACGDGLLHLG